MRSLGEAGVVERESEAFLIENEVDYSEFSEEVLACLPKQLPWSVPQVRGGLSFSVWWQSVVTIIVKFGLTSSLFSEQVCWCTFIPGGGWQAERLQTRVCGDH